LPLIRQGPRPGDRRNENNWKRYNFNGLTLTQFVELDSEGFRWNFPGDPQFPNDEIAL